MQNNDQAAERVRPVVSKLRGAKTPSSAKRGSAKTVRLQLHLGEQVAKRLAVHAALSGRNQSRVTEEVLLSWLSRFGQGKEIFDAVSPVDSAVEAES